MRQTRQPVRWPEHLTYRDGFRAFHGQLPRSAIEPRTELLPSGGQRTERVGLLQNLDVHLGPLVRQSGVRIDQISLFWHRRQSQDDALDSGKVQQLSRALF